MYHIIINMDAPKGSGSYFRPKTHIQQTHSQHLSTRTQSSTKALIATGWGKQKETLMATYKAVMRPALEYAYSIWSPLASSTSINKLQVMQNVVLRIATGFTQDTNLQHLHDETLTLPIHEHLQLHVSQYKQKTQHPLHKHTTYLNTPRLKTAATQQTFQHTPRNHYNRHKTNMCHIHTSIVSRHLATRGNNKILVEILPRITHRTLAQLRTNKSHKVALNHIHHYAPFVTPTHIISSISPRCHSWTCGQTPLEWRNCWPDGRRSWLVDLDREDRTPPPPLARVKGVGRQQHTYSKLDINVVYSVSYYNKYVHWFSNVM